MKTCRNCKKMIRDNCSICPYCDTPSNSNGGEKSFRYRVMLLLLWCLLFIGGILSVVGHLYYSPEETILPLGIFTAISFIGAVYSLYKLKTRKQKRQSEEIYTEQRWSTGEKKEKRNRTKDNSPSRTVENTISGIIIAVIAVIMLTNLDSEWLKQWFHAPIMWRDPSYIKISLVDKQEETWMPHNERGLEGQVALVFSIRNLSGNDIDSCQFYYYIDGYENRGSIKNLKAHAEIGYTERWSLENSEGKLLYGKELDEISFSFHIKSVEIGTKKVVNQNSTWKLVLIGLISIIAVILVWKDCIKSPVVRVILKVLMVPAIVLLAGLAAIPDNTKKLDSQYGQHGIQPRNYSFTQSDLPDSDSSEKRSNGHNRPVSDKKHEPQLYKDFIIRYSVGSGGEVFTERVMAVEGGMVRKMIQAKYPGKHINVFLCVPESQYKGS